MEGNENSRYASFNEEFCLILEYRLGLAFHNSDQMELQGFWCDGVDWNIYPEDFLTKKSINDKRKIITRAWIGKTGQDLYEMTIRFGKYSLRRYARGTKMIDCIPKADTMDWIDIDVEYRAIEVRLK